MSLATRLFNSTRSNEYAINPPASTNSENGYIAGSFAAPIRFAMREWFAKTEGYLKILRAIADLDMFWVEIDSFNPEALGAKVRTRSHPVKRCWACANSCLISASRRWMSRSSTRRGTGSGNR